MRYFLLTFGCTLNQADSNIIRGVLGAKGWRETKSERAANVLIVNSCTVKSATESKILHLLHKYAERPLVLAGCLSVDPARVRKAHPRACIVGTGAIGKIVSAARAAVEGRCITLRTRGNKEKLPRFRRTGVIAKIPIAEGCLGACTFCQTRLARGKLQSYTPKSVVREIELALGQGAREIQLTAQDTGAYGQDIGTNLAALLRAIDEIPGDFKVRLGMINPEHALRSLPELLRCLRSAKFYKFLHLPVQSGSDAVLKTMRRNYTVAQFSKVAKAFRKEFPEGILATDIIVGFPGETEAQYRGTEKLARALKFEVVNVSKFTPRPFTLAKQMEQLPNTVIKERSASMSRLCHQIAETNNQRFLGKTLAVRITEKQRDYTGRDENYRQVAVLGGGSGPGGKVPGGKIRLGKEVKVKITEARSGCLLGRPQKHGFCAKPKAGKNLKVSDVKEA